MLLNIQVLNFDGFKFFFNNEIDFCFKGGTVFLSEEDSKTKPVSLFLFYFQGND